VSWSPDGQRLVSAGVDGAVKVWDAHTGQNTLTLQGHTRGVLSVSWSPDGQRLVSAGVDGAVKVWDAHTGQNTLTLRGHTAFVTRVSWSPDGQWITSRDSTGIVKTWDLHTGQEFPGSGLPSDQASALSPDRRYRCIAGRGFIYVVETQLSDDERARRVARTLPSPGWHAREAQAAEQGRRWFAVVFHLDHLLALRPNDVEAHVQRGRAHAEMGHWPQAAADFGHAAEHGLLRAEVIRNLALTQLAARQDDAYQRTCERLLHEQVRAGDAAACLLLAPDPEQGLGRLLTAAVLTAPPPDLLPDRAGALRTCVLRAEGVADPARLLPLAEHADPVTRAAVQYRAGHPTAAVQALGEARDGAGGLYRALVELSLGHADAARAALAKANAWLDSPSPEDGKLSNYAALSWGDRLEIDLLRREVQTRLTKKPE
jgi:hypothetical protein